VETGAMTLFRVMIATWTHKIDALTEGDSILAAKIDKL
jgi:pterin-4a-carbinolamine dehydratase